MDGAYFNFLFTWIGAISCHILSQYPSDFKGCLPFLRKICPGIKDKYYNWIELILLPLIGSVIATMTLEPTNIKNAFFAGFTWIGTMEAISNTQKKEK